MSLLCFIVVLSGEYGRCFNIHLVEVVMSCRWRVRYGVLREVVSNCWYCRLQRILSSRGSRRGYKEENLVSI